MTVEAETQLEKVISALNAAYTADPLAIRALLINVVPCNQALADHPTVQVGPYSDGYLVGALGFLNGALEAAGIGIIASKWTTEADAEGRHTLLGFQGYSNPGA